MMVKFLLPKTDLDAWERVVRFTADGLASLTTERMHLGSVLQIGEEEGLVIIIADVAGAKRSSGTSAGAVL
jgi:hypothetical protein